MVHVHALVYGEYIPQSLLQSAWSKAVGEERAIAHVTSVNGANGVAAALREVLKYATKGETGRAQASYAAAVEIAFRNVHRVAIGGALRKVKITADDRTTEDVRPEDLHDDHTMACESCGVIGGGWDWIGVFSSEAVEQIGGFGLVSLAAPTHYGTG
jgi:hypothetical protein